jgi:hypothetical protein
VGRDEIGEDEGFERRWQIAQRIAWLFLAVFVIAGLAGVFGRGPISSIRAASASGLATVEYDRFARFEAPAVLKVSVDPHAATNGSVSVLVSGPVLEALRIEQTSPRPLWVKAAPDGELFAFAAAGAGDRVSIRFGEEPRHTGHLTGRLQVDSRGGSVAISQIVYP